MRSAEVSASARRRVSEKLLRWADLVLGMEAAHKRKLREDFPEVFHELRMEAIEIPDDYEFMDTAFIELIQASVEPLLSDSA